jgi:hypothetical protein
MESMYQQWSGMTLETKYEDSLLSLCILVLKCIDVIINMSSAESFDAALLQTSMDKVNEVDAVCRDFSVTFLDSALDHEIEDVSDSDSDATICNVQSTKRTIEEASASASGLDGAQSSFNDTLQTQGKAKRQRT